MASYMTKQIGPLPLEDEERSSRIERFHRAAKIMATLEMYQTKARVLVSSLGPCILHPFLVSEGLFTSSGETTGFVCSYFVTQDREFLCSCLLLQNFWNPS